MTCDQKLKAQAYADGELDAIEAAEVERHIEACAECARLFADVKSLREGMRRSLRYHRAGDSLRRQVLGTLDREARPTRSFIRPFWTGALSGVAATALAASLALMLWLPSAQTEVADEMLSAHLRSLMDNHLIDVASSNHHVVKPWFAGRVDISPAVADFTSEGFALDGGRIDYVHGQRMAVLVYRHGAHVANVFAWKDDGALSAGLRTINGYHLLTWKTGGISYCAVSDMSSDELGKLADLVRGNRAG